MFLSKILEQKQKKKTRTLRNHAVNRSIANKKKRKKKIDGKDYYGRKNMDFSPMTKFF